MISKCRGLWILGAAFLFAASACLAQPCPSTYRPVSVLDLPVDAATAIRFFYDPGQGYFHFPLVFRVVEEGDPLLDAAPMREEGRTAYITVSEMRGLVQGLADSGLGWQETEVVEELGPAKKLGLTDSTGLDTMDVRVVSSKGTAKAEISPKAICMVLKPLDAALKTPRALWEFQRFQLNYGCKVPGYKYGAYPGRD